MKEYTVKNRTVLVICGVSGSGKSCLEKNLINDYPDLFHKMVQLTSRSPRPKESQGNPYVFINRETFKLLENKLIGVIGKNEDSLYKDFYGSIPEFVENKISTIILAEEGILDLANKLDNNLIEECYYGIIGLDTNYDELDEEEKISRIGRDYEFIDRERMVLQYADIVLNSANGKYVKPKEIVDYLISKNIIAHNI